MKKSRIYIETSVVSYFVAKPSRDHVIAGRQEATRTLWPRLATEYECYVSALVYQEAGKGNPVESRARLIAIERYRVLELGDEARRLAEDLIRDRGIPKEYPEDALHIGISATNGMDILLTWNYSHLNNPFTRRRVRQLVEGLGYVCPEICSPDQLLEA